METVEKADAAQLRHCSFCGNPRPKYAHFCFSCGGKNQGFCHAEFAFEYGMLLCCAQERECDNGHPVGKIASRTSPHMSHCELCGLFLGTTQ